jgi:hypothetical protein
VTIKPAAEELLVVIMTKILACLLGGNVRDVSFIEWQMSDYNMKEP